MVSYSVQTMSKQNSTDELFAIVSPRPSFLTGAARVLDLAGVLTEFNLEALSDAAALSSDWQAVGDDLRAAIGAATDSSRSDPHGHEPSPAGPAANPA